MLTSFDYRLEEEPRYPVSYCEQCGEALYNGDEVVVVGEYLNTHFCDHDCLDRYMDIKEVRIGD